MHYNDKIIPFFLKTDVKKPAGRIEKMASPVVHFFFCIGGEKNFYAVSENKKQGIGPRDLRKTYPVVAGPAKIEKDGLKTLPDKYPHVLFTQVDPPGFF
jgi:hypothetical protein